MRVTYVVRSFLDYRVPVLKALDGLLEGQLSVLFSAHNVPQRVTAKVGSVLGDRAQALTGERRIGPESIQGFANRSLRLVYQPGILRAIAESRPDVLIGDGFYQWTSFALAYRLRHGTPLVVAYERTAHTERNAQRLRVAYRRLVLRHVDAMTVNGRLSSEYSESLGMSCDRITMGQMVADTANLAARTAEVSADTKAALRESWGSPDLVFLFVGRLIELKGVRELLAGWALLESKIPGNWRLVLVGAGEAEGALREQVAALGLQQVVFEGHVDYDAIAPYYAAADVFVIPTLEDNWSLVVPEAMACGLPVLCSPYNGCHPELVEQGGNGWVFDPLNAEDTFGTLERCTRQKETLVDMGERSRQIVANHTPEHAARAILDACEIAVRHRGG